jgi:hypothetical protein
MRVTSDFHALNAVAENLAYPTEDVNTIVRWLATKQVYSVADLRDGYYNVNLQEKDRHLTAVRTVLGNFEYAVMTQGLKGACDFFQKLFNEGYVGLRVLCAAKDETSVEFMRPLLKSSAECSVVISC